jgi:hypothetical protein
MDHGKYSKKWEKYPKNKAEVGDAGGAPEIKVHCATCQRNRLRILLNGAPSPSVLCPANGAPFLRNRLRTNAQFAQLSPDFAQLFSQKCHIYAL